MKTTTTQNIMKSKIKVLTVFGILMLCMSSCVYSLFPIYTEENQVFIPEIVGKWQAVDDDNSYVLIESFAYESAKNELSKGDNTPFTVTYAEGYIIENGDTIRDANLRKALESKKPEVKDAIKGTMDGLRKAAIKSNMPRNPVSNKSYRMTMVDNGNTQIYEMNLAKIGNDLFMDLYIDDSGNDLDDFSMVLFPVHTFLKIELNDGQLDLINFDWQKLNKLFESKLIRMRHENVDGTILITAQPKELEKFLDKYSDDDSVFDNERGVYTRVQ
jgi:hypothetical protein